MPGFAWRELDCVRVKGKEQPVVIYEPLGPAAETSTTTVKNAALFKKMLNCYRACQWDEAEDALTELEQGEPHPLYQLYRNRIAYFRINPPETGWDGVFIFETKRKKTHLPNLLLHFCFFSQAQQPPLAMKISPKPSP